MTTFPVRYLVGRRPDHLVGFPVFGCARPVPGGTPVELDHPAVWHPARIDWEGLGRADLQQRVLDQFRAYDAYVVEWVTLVSVRAIVERHITSEYPGSYTKAEIDGFLDDEPMLLSLWRERSKDDTVEVCVPAVV